MNGCARNNIGISKGEVDRSGCVNNGTAAGKVHQKRCCFGTRIAVVLHKAKGRHKHRQQERHSHVEVPSGKNDETKNEKYQMNPIPAGGKTCTCQ